MFFRNRNAFVPIRDAVSIVQHSIVLNDLIQYPGFRARAVDSAIDDVVLFPSALLEQCAESHALVSVSGHPLSFIKAVNSQSPKRIGIRKGFRDGVPLRFESVVHGYWLVRLKPPGPIFGKDLISQEMALSDVQPNEQVAHACVAILAAVGLYDKYAVDITGGPGSQIRTADNFVGDTHLGLISSGLGYFSVQTFPDVPASNITAIGAIQPRQQL